MLQRFRNKLRIIRISCNYTCWVLSYVFWYIERKYKRKNCSNDDSTFGVSNRPSINFAHYCVWSTKIDITQQKVNTKCFKYIPLDTIHLKFSKESYLFYLNFKEMLTVRNYFDCRKTHFLLPRFQYDAVANEILLAASLH